MNRISLSIDKELKDVLLEIAKEKGYGSLSATIRVMIKKYSKQELEG
jgi:metal-responsive CopG/Arc/MetJ family transcriptional regulator